jgi:RES domain-containing protein
MELAQRVERAFEDHYYRTPEQPDHWQYTLLNDPESSYEWTRHGLPVLEAIQQAAEIPPVVARDVLEILSLEHDDLEFGAAGENEFDPDSYYDEKSPDDLVWQRRWQEFEQSLWKEARFFSRQAAELLHSVFGGIDQLRTGRGAAAVLEAGPGQALDHLYRARVFQATETLEVALGRPDLHLGPPPAALASAGRMNARGISVFYGATTPSTAVAEVRPPVGSEVAVARFDIIRPLRLLDLTALDNVAVHGSVFEQSLRAKRERAAFLQTLGGHMTRPVMPDDEAFDYLATQAVGDFLATENQPPLDGILFPSTQVRNGRNVVLFHKSSRVQLLDLPKGTEVHAESWTETDEGPEPDYVVTETIPSAKDITAPGSVSGDIRQGHAGWDHSPPTDEDGRPISLQVDAEDVSVHRVEAVQFECSVHAVRRHRYEASEDGLF